MTRDEVEQVQEELNSLSDLLYVANKELLKHEREIERLRGLLQEAKHMTQMAVWGLDEQYSGIASELAAFLEKLKQEPRCDTSSS